MLSGALALWLVLWPLCSPGARPPAPAEPPDPEETAAGVALTALKEIEFDRETGKLSDADYDLPQREIHRGRPQALRAEAPDDIEAMVALESGCFAPLRLRYRRTLWSALRCGPRPEPDAVFCSGCGVRLAVAGRCDRCGAALAPDSRFCEGCGSRVAA